MKVSTLMIWYQVALASIGFFVLGTQTEIKYIISSFVLLLIAVIIGFFRDTYYKLELMHDDILALKKGGKQ